MFEYEFRLVVNVPNAFHLLKQIDRPQKLYKVLYAKPHFRFKNNSWEWKRNISSVVVYHLGLWFRWIKSKEISFEQWSNSMHKEFVDVVGFYQNPFLIETRLEITLNDKAKVYAFRKRNDVGLVFELES
ncbi:uncharacterized protein TNIN_122831, partial [Trichonephila inaurata madagascariensis]